MLKTCLFASIIRWHLGQASHRGVAQRCNESDLGSGNPGAYGPIVGPGWSAC
jgi:hypothetical protein